MNKLILFEPTLDDLRWHTASVLISDFIYKSDNLKRKISTKYNIDWSYKPKEVCLNDNYKDFLELKRKDCYKKVAQISEFDLLLNLKKCDLLPESRVIKIVDINGRELTRDFYTSIRGERDSLVILENYNSQIDELYDLAGDKSTLLNPVYSYAHDLMLGYSGYFVARSSDIDSYVFDLYRYTLKDLTNVSTDSLSDRKNYICSVGPFQSDLIMLQGPIHGFSEGKSWMAHGFINEKFETVSPQCFLSGSNFSEGIAAVCFSGKWGYVDHQYEPVIQFKFGYTEPFSGEFARVLLLNDNYVQPIGTWSKFPTDSVIFEPKHGIEHKDKINHKLPDVTSYPDIFFTNKNSQFQFSVVDLIETYHCFGISLYNETQVKDLSKYGKWAVIDKQGNALYAQQDSEKISQVNNGRFCVIRNEKCFLYRITGTEIILEQEINYSKENCETVSYDSPYFISIDQTDYRFGLYNYFPNPITSNESIIIKENSLTPGYKTTHQKELSLIELIFGFAQATDEQKDGESYVIKLLESGMDSNCLEHASDRLKKDKVFLSKAIDIDPNAIEFADKNLQLRYIEDKVWLKRYLKGIRNAYDTKQAAIEKKLSVLKNSENEIKDILKESDYVIELCEIEPGVYIYLSDKLKNDDEIIKSCLCRDFSLLEYMPDNVKSNKELILTALMNGAIRCYADARAVEFLSETLRDDEQVWDLFKSQPYSGHFLNCAGDRIKKSWIDDAERSIPNNDTIELPF